MRGTALLKACCDLTILAPRRYSLAPSYRRVGWPRLAVGVAIVDGQSTMPSANQMARMFFDALNARDVAHIVSILSPDIHHHDLAHEAQTSHLAVARFYSELVSGLPESMQFVIDDMTEGDPHRVGVTWHLELGGNQLPCACGLSFYRIDATGRICYVRQSPEHVVKLGSLAQSVSGLVATPLINALGASPPDLWSSVTSFAGSLLAGPAPTETLSHSSNRPGAAPTVKAMEHLAGRAGLLTAAQPHHHLSAPQIAPSVDSPSCQQSAAGAPSPSSPPSPALPQRSDASPAPALSPTASVVPEGPAVNNVVAFSVHIPRTDEAPQALGGGSSSSCGGGAVTAHSGTHQERIANTGGRSPSRRGASPCRRDAPPARAMTLEGPMVAATPVQGSLELLEQAGAAVRPQDLAGLWAKDPVASDVEGYERALDLWQISGAQKATARLIEGLEIAVHGNTFSVHFLTIIPMFKVTEAYDLARPVVMMRRDLRPGQATATAGLGAHGVTVAASWSAPFAGRFEEAYELRDGGSTLEVTSTISVGTTSATTVQVYRRQARGMKREHLLSASERRHGKPTDILRRFGMPSF